MNDLLGDDPECDYSLTFDRLEDLSSSAGQCAPECNSIYALSALMGHFDRAFNNYTEINNGYDDKFDAYVRYVKLITPFAIEEFLQDGDSQIDALWMYHSLELTHANSRF